VEVWQWYTQIIVLIFSFENLETKPGFGGACFVSTSSKTIFLGYVWI